MSSLLTRLWSHAKHALSRLRATLPRLDTLLASERRHLRTSLRALEALCRRLAITEAVRLDRGSSDPHSSSAGVFAGLKIRGPRTPTLRFWPRAKRTPVRIRLLGRPTAYKEMWRGQHRDALIARLRTARAKPAHLRLADRIDALQRFLDAPRATLRRLARKLRLQPKIVYVITARRAPCSRELSLEIVREAEALCWTAIRDTS